MGPTQPLFFSLGTGYSSPGVKWLGYEADYSSPSGAEVIKERSKSRTSLYAFTAHIATITLIIHIERFHSLVIVSIIINHTDV